ncbi:uncharacterized protein LOC102345202 isoform X3 [Latimeria chalumnae]|uniref:uncharacterized protein LOC102345202 isoform X3 n=1 Tax=Latimeria chalumnae TaxID=7897 RepID=UPI00313C5E60
MASFIQPWIVNLLLNYEATDDPCTPVAGQVMKFLAEDEIQNEDLQDCAAAVRISDLRCYIKAVITKEAKISMEQEEQQYSFRDLENKVIILRNFSVRFGAGNKLENCEFYLFVEQFRILPMETTSIDDAFDCHKDRFIWEKQRKLWQEHLRMTSDSSDLSVTHLLDVAAEQKIAALKDCAQWCLGLTDTARPSTSRTALTSQLANLSRTGWKAARLQHKGGNVFTVPIHWLLIPSEQQAALDNIKEWKEDYVDARMSSDLLVDKEKPTEKPSSESEQMEQCDLPSSLASKEATVESRKALDKSPRKEAEPEQMEQCDLPSSLASKEATVESRKALDKSTWKEAILDKTLAEEGTPANHERESSEAAFPDSTPEDMNTSLPTAMSNFLELCRKEVRNVDLSPLLFKDSSFLSNKETLDKTSEEEGSNGCSQNPVSSRSLTCGQRLAPFDISQIILSPVSLVSASLVRNCRDTSEFFFAGKQCPGQIASHLLTGDADGSVTGRMSRSKARASNRHELHKKGDLSPPFSAKRKQAVTDSESDETCIDTDDELEAVIVERALRQRRAFGPEQEKSKRAMPLTKAARELKKPPSCKTYADFILCPLRDKSSQAWVLPKVTQQAVPQKKVVNTGDGEPRKTAQQLQKHSDGSSFKYKYEAPSADLVARVNSISRISKQLLEWAIQTITQ